LSLSKTWFVVVLLVGGGGGGDELPERKGRKSMGWWLEVGFLVPFFLLVQGRRGSNKGKTTDDEAAHQPINKSLFSLLPFDSNVGVGGGKKVRASPFVLWDQRELRKRNPFHLARFSPRVDKCRDMKGRKMTFQRRAYLRGVERKRARREMVSFESTPRRLLHPFHLPLEFSR